MGDEDGGQSRAIVDIAQALAQFAADFCIQCGASFARKLHVVAARENDRGGNHNDGQKQDEFKKEAHVFRIEHK